MIVLSMKRCFARFTSSAWRCSHNCFQRPRASQRLKRLYTASQWPKSCGKSRHGMPVRAIYNTASINMRSLCSGGLPALCLISAKMVAISAHAASVSTSLTLVISFPHDPITHHRGKDTYSRGNSSTRPSFLSVTNTDGFYKSAYDLVREYAAVNPHSTFTYHEPGEECSERLERTTDTWRKWLPRDPTSAHWYTVARLRTLVTAYIAEERRGGRRRTVREFVCEFAGLSSTAKQKQVTEAAGLSRASLHDLVVGSDVSHDGVRGLLVAMQEACRPV